MVSFLFPFFKKGHYKIHEMQDGSVETLPIKYTSLREAKKAATRLSKENKNATYAVINIPMARKEFTA